MRPEDGMRKLRQMEKSQGLWAMECQLMIDGKNVVVFDKKTGQDVEAFPLELVCEPTSVVSEEKKDAAYNNIILFTVLEDGRRKSSPPTEMHIFQCAADVRSADIVDEIYKMKETRLAMTANERGSTHQVESNSYKVTHHVEAKRSQFRPFYPNQYSSNSSIENGLSTFIKMILFKFDEITI